MSRATSAAEPYEQLRPYWDSEATAGDCWAGSYDLIYDAWQPCFRAYRERIAEAVYSCWYEARGRVLDAGCGTGGVLELLTTRIPSRLLAGVDIAAKMVERASARVKSVEFCTTPLEEYVATEPFDVIFFANSLCHMPDLRLVGQRLAEIATPGARVLVFEYNTQWMYANRGPNLRARLSKPDWWWWRFRSAGRMRCIAEAASALPPLFREPLAAETVAAAFAPHLRLRSRRTSFGLTRLYENVITDAQRVADPTRPVSHQQRPWSKKLVSLHEADRHFAEQFPHAGGITELVFDR